MTPPKSSIRHGSTQRGQSASTPLENKGSLDTSKHRKMPGKGSRVPSGPWGRLKPVDQDPLESMGLPSKGDNRLLDFKAQEKYYTKIVDRYLSCCTEAGKREELLKRFAAMELSEASKPSKPPEHADPSSLIKSKGKDLHHDSALKAKGKDKDIPRLSTEEAQNPANTKALSDVMMALRKLREGIVASDRKDDFAVQTYLFNIRLSILIKNPDSYHPAILYLLKKLHEARPLTPIELAEVVSYLILDTACRRKELAEAFSLRQRYGLKDKHIDAVLGALVHDNYVQFRKVKRVVDGHKSKLMEFAEADMRLLTLKCFGRTYLGCDAQFLEAMAGKKWDDLVKDDSVGWERDGEKIVIRRVKR